MDTIKLDALEGLVSEVDGEAPPTAEQQREQQEQAAKEEQLETGARSWGMIAFAIGGGLSLIAPELKQVYTEDACMQWGRSMMPVAEKYGWNSPGALPELGLLMTTMSLAVPSVLAVRTKLQQAKAAKTVDVEARESAPAADGQ
jgi:hypothetical protein